jgi:hypothetical protein
MKVKASVWKKIKESKLNYNDSYKRFFASLTLQQLFVLDALIHLVPIQKINEKTTKQIHKRLRIK